MRKLVLAALLLTTSLAFGSAANIYLANANSGTADGSSCANAKIWTFFNTAGNWGAGSTQIGAGTTVHICGTITASSGSSMTFQGSGAVGNPVTVLFESGAVMQSTAWGNGAAEGACPCSGAFTISGQSNIVIDGGGTPATGSNPAGMSATNGVIKNTGNGGIGIYIKNATHVVVKNLIIGPIHSNSAAAFERASADVIFDGGLVDVVVQNNQLLTAGTAVAVQGSLGGSNPPPEIKNNFLSDHCWQIGQHDGDTTLVVLIDGNEITNWSATAPDTACHTDGFFTNDGIAYIYNNYFHDGLDGGNPTAGVYCTYPTDPPSGFHSSCFVFNNIFENIGPTPQTVNGGEGGPEKVYNNTYYNSQVAEFWEIQGAGTQAFFRNNIAIYGANTWGPNSTFPYDNSRFGFNDVTAFVVDSDYNDYFNFTQWDGNAPNRSLATWRTATGFDTHSFTTNPNLATSFPHALQSGSPAIGAGNNLTSLCTGFMVPLCSDRLGNARPSVGNWDMGATQFSSTPVAPPALAPAIFADLAGGWIR